MTRPERRSGARPRLLSPQGRALALALLAGLGLAVAFWAIRL